MHKMMIVAAFAAIATLTGCKSIEVERHAQTLATVKNADGSEEVVRDKDNNPIVLDGGWYLDYFQHWNWQQIEALSAKAGKDVSLDINKYAGGADPTNLTALVSASFDGGTKLVTAIGEAYVKIAGGGAQATTVLSSAQQIYDYFVGKGGDASKATVTTNSASNTLQVSDGTTCVECDSQGVCSDCTTK